MVKMDDAPWKNPQPKETEDQVTLRVLKAQLRVDGLKNAIEALEAL